MTPNTDSGIYVAVFHLPQPRSIKVGALGLVRFKAGIYAYVGSAQKNLTARLQRHARHRKPLRWHIDYLSTKATMVGASGISLSRPLSRYIASMNRSIPLLRYS